MSIIYTEVDPITGISTAVHKNDDKWTFQKKYDAAPFLDVAAAARAETEGDRWGDMRHVGFIPMAVLATFYRQDGGFDSSRCVAWLKANPAMVTFSKVLK